MDSSKQHIMPISLIISGFIVSLLIILLSSLGVFKGIDSLVISVTGNIQTDTLEFFDNTTQSISIFNELANIYNQNQVLTDKVVSLESQVIELEKQIKDYSITAKQAQFDLPFDLQPVRVIAYDQINTGEILINKGLESNLDLGMILVRENFAIGEIIAVENNFSRVRLITSPDSIIPVLTLNSNTKGLSKGQFGVNINVTEILDSSKVIENEPIITLGLNSNFPYGLIIGSVGKVVSVESDISKSLEVNPAVEFNNLKNLFVITNQ